MCDCHNKTGLVGEVIKGKDERTVYMAWRRKGGVMMEATQYWSVWYLKLRINARRAKDSSLAMRLVHFN